MEAHVQVMDDLLKGQEFATQLQMLLRESPAAGKLMDVIVQTFSRAINALDAAKAAGSSPCPEEQGELTCGRKRKAGASGEVGGRKTGCRRRTQQLSVRTVATKNLDDGQAWRKYGQKDIQNSNHPKAYFRCTHKYEQGCKAQRQVQRSDDDPNTYNFTYIGAHTCRDPATISHVIHQSGSDLKGSRLISFAPNASTTTTSTTTTAAATANQLGQDGALGSGIKSLKPEGDQEEVLSSLTPAGSSVAAEAVQSAAAATAPGPAEQGDVTSGFSSFPEMEFFNDQVLDFDLEDIVIDFCA